MTDPGSGAEATLPDKENIGLLLVNLGSPEAPTVAAVRRYLAEFLWDKRVVEIPRPVWWLILHLFVLRFRPAKSARAYEKIWGEDGSPLTVITKSIGDRLRETVKSHTEKSLHIKVAMRYGAPSIQGALDALRGAGVDRIVVLPLYPQYSAATTASVFDALVSHLSPWRVIPGISFIRDYHARKAYIDTVADSIRAFWDKHGAAEYLLFSFHGLPERSRTLGDPYYDQCHATAALVAETLGLEENAWQVVFQSRFGRAEWLKPYCVDTLADLPKHGIRNVDIVCPGFSVDCLETLEEIAITNKNVFMDAGGTGYRYIPALNASEAHVRMLAGIVGEYI